MKLSLSLLETDQYIINQILEALKDRLTDAFNKSEPYIKTDIKNLLEESLRSEPEYQSLKSGVLRAEFGIQYPESVDKIVNKLSETVTIDRNPIVVSQRGLKGGFSLVAIQSDNISGLIDDIDGMIVDDTKGYKLPWLEWLLLKGSDRIIKNYEVSFGPYDNSRSGMAIMKESKSSWRVPPQFSGTSKDNWTTRAISKIDDQIQSSIITNLERYL